MSLEPLAAIPENGRTFNTSRRVRTGDIDSERRLRLDGIARYLQDIGSDNLEAVHADATHPLWIVRRTVIDVLEPAVWPERVHLRRWCSAFSTRWTNMRVQIAGDSGALIETEAFWIHISQETGMPTRIEDDFLDRLGETTDEHRLKWKRRLTESAPASDEDGVAETDFTLRATDIDPFDHVNNAIYWQAVEELLSPDMVAVPHRAIVEYLAPIVSTDKIVLRTRRDSSAFTVWFLVDDTLKAVARVTPLEATRREQSGSASGVLGD